MTTRRQEFMMVGLGGQGVLVAGQVLAQAAAGEYQHVLWFPSYYQSLRGGECECTVILSDEQIASPLLSQSATVVVMDENQLKTFEGRIRPGGRLFLESSNNGHGTAVSRSDVKVVRVPAVAAAEKLGSAQSANLVMLGVFVGKTSVVSPELVEKELERRFAGKDAVLARNKQAFAEGLKMAANLPG